tara:strand:- start:843 stop:1121 length:279 start_codon:yes stop_codon:yes gene_type:complete
MTPQGCKGEWKWNGFEITSTGTDTDGEQFQRKGKWMWLPKVDDSKNAWMANATPQEISEYFKPKDNTLTISNTIILTLIVAIVTGITLIITL